jgi:hypothetical protein
MTFHPDNYISSLAQQQSFDPESRQKPYGRLGAAPTFTNTELKAHLSLTSDVHEVKCDSDRLPTQTMEGYFFNKGVVHLVSDSVVRSFLIIDRLIFL